jgi:hypothetical protein
MIQEAVKTTKVKVDPFVRLDVPGCKPVILTIDDMTSGFAYVRLVRGDKKLEARDFKEKDMFIRYWLWSLGLLEYPFLIIAGREGGGKSLLLGWLGNVICRLFPPKRATLDFAVPPMFDDPPIYDIHGNQIKYTNGVSRWKDIQRFSLFDEDFLYNILDRVDSLSRYEKENNGQRPPQSELAKCYLWNTTFALGETKTYAEKGVKSNLLTLIGRIITARRHFHCGMAMAYVDQLAAPGIQIFDRRTHNVTCSKQKSGNRVYCEYWISQIYGDRLVRKLILWPDENQDLWISEDIPQFAHNLELHFGNIGAKLAKKRQEERDKLKEVNDAV